MCTHNHGAGDEVETEGQLGLVDSSSGRDFDSVVKIVTKDHMRFVPGSQDLASCTRMHSHI